MFIFLCYIKLVQVLPKKGAYKSFLWQPLNTISIQIKNVFDTYTHCIFQMQWVVNAYSDLYNLWKDFKEIKCTEVH